MSKFKTLLHKSTTHYQYEKLLLKQLEITKTKLSRIENNPGEIDFQLIGKISEVTKVSENELFHNYDCGKQVLSISDAAKLGLITK